MAIALVLAQMMRDDGDHGNGWWWAMGVGWLLVLALAVVVVVVVVQRSGPSANRGGNPPSASAEAILAERLARGEIDEDEYRRRRDALIG